MGPYLLYSCLIYLLGIALSQSLMSLGSLMLAGTFFFLLMEKIFDPKQRQELLNSKRSNLAALAMITLFIANGAIQLYISYDPKIFEWAGIKHLPLFCIPFIPTLIKDRELQWPRKSFHICQKIYALAFASSCLFALYQAIIENKMATAWMKNPIYLAYNLLFQIVMIAVLIPKLNKSARPWAIGLIGLGLGAIFATNSRMASLCVVIIVAGILGKWLLQNFSKKWLALSLSALFIFAVSEYVRKPYVQDRLQNAINLNSPSWRGRLKAWDHNIELIQEHPLVGVGIMQNALYTKDLNAVWQNLWSEDVAIYAHSVYLQMLAESGIIGSIIFLSALVFLWKSLPILAWPLLTLALSGITENVLSNSKPLHAFLGCLLVLGLLSKLGYLDLPSDLDKDRSRHA